MQARIKNAELRRGVPLPPETRDKIRTAKLGVPRSEATKEKLRIAGFKRVVSAETRERISKNNLGKRLGISRPDEVKKKVSLGLKAYYARKKLDQASAAEITASQDVDSPNLDQAS